MAGLAPHPHRYNVCVYLSYKWCMYINYIISNIIEINNHDDYTNINYCNYIENIRWFHMKFKDWPPSSAVWRGSHHPASSVFRQLLAFTAGGILGQEWSDLVWSFRFFRHLFKRLPWSTHGSDFESHRKLAKNRCQNMKVVGGLKLVENYYIVTRIYASSQ